MKVYLMYRDRDFDFGAQPPPFAAALVADLELPTIVASMARGDAFLADVALKALLASTVDLDTIRYRQAVMRDCIRNEDVIRAIYALAVDTIEAEKKNYFATIYYAPGIVLSRARDVMKMLVQMLHRLRAFADEHAGSVESEGLTTLFAMLRRELGDEYFADIVEHLRKLAFGRGVLVSARLGVGNKGRDYVLRETPPPRGNWFTRLFEAGPPAYSYQLPERDEAGARALGDLRDRGLDLVANALAQSTTHIVSFFRVLRTELAFYVGCLNLRASLQERGYPVAFPEPVSAEERRHTTAGLYDVALALSLRSRIVSNDVHADAKSLVIVTGANQGGKSTFLRSIGQAQLMLQCGLFVGADAFTANVCPRIFTHYKREEDTTMTSGKFDEELARASAIVDAIVPNSLVLFNESFAATNEREGSEIARQIASALLDDDVKMFFVTHQYEFAHGFYAAGLPAVAFVRAEREPNGARTFRIVEGEPLETSFGEDLYRQVFGERIGA